jgi:hypothetical protein
MEEDFKNLAACYLSFMEGDTGRIEYAYTLMRKYDLLDEEGYMKYDDED